MNRSLFIFSAESVLDDRQEAMLSSQLKTFLSTWNAHGESLVTDFEIRQQIFLIIFIDVEKTGISGCSKDTLFQFIQSLEASKMIFLNRKKVWLSHQHKPVNISLDSIKDFVAGKNMKQIMLYNIWLDKEKDLSGKWLIPLESSWIYKKYLSS